MVKLYFWRFLSVISILVFLAPVRLLAQSYGLGFYSHEVEQDKRTGLNLSPSGPMCFSRNFSVSFDFKFVPGLRTYFGYILRIVEDDKRNFDFVYDNEADTFTMIVGEELTSIKFRISKNRLLDQWNRFTITFDRDADDILLTAAGKEYKHHIGFTKIGCYKFYFGATADKNFGTSDVPPMKLRDIKITEDDNLKYYWPLNDKSGLLAREVIGGKNAAVVNPLWFKAEHFYWKQQYSRTVKGPASAAFDAKKEQVVFLANDSLYTYDVKTGKLSGRGYQGAELPLNIGNQSIVDQRNGRLYNFYPDDGFFAAYDHVNGTFNKPFKAAPITDFIQINKFISPFDSSLYTLGGYGHHQYRNMFRRYRLNTGTWDTIKTKGDFFTPRYLAALGTTAGADTAYILGGYGNTSGQQILKPKSLYDMMQFTVKDHKLKKLFELKPNGEDFVFANSLIVDKKTNSYYAVIFPELKFDSKLQLIKGSLTNNSYTAVGSQIPFPFNDIRSFADVFYAPQSNKFIVVTLLRSMDDKRSDIKILTLAGPPETGEASVIVGRPQRYRFWFWLCAIVVAIPGLIFLIGWVGWLKKRIKPVPSSRVDPVPDVPATLPDVIPPHNSVVSNSQFIVVDESVSAPGIYLFGELQLLAANGQEIVSSFTRLTKELFIFLFLQSVRSNRGVSAEKLIETLWFDKDEKSARNNRSVNMAKLKNVLDQLGPCVISRETGYYRIDTDYTKIHVDYYNYLQIVRDQSDLTRDKIIRLAGITQRGKFLSNCEYEWLDQSRAEVTDEIIDTYLRYVHQNSIDNDPEFFIKIANYIFLHDTVNEEAMRVKCKALVFLGKHSLAKSTYDNFRKEYKGIYQEDFKEDYGSVLE
ncbi:galactose oxidase [Mucilaginibacter angelicae]|uniref:Galactose oxidase n=1 Tax=Mucilaginibacter angelicae TaxID=869718 RepID=A0ABV6KZX5_9SPHI